MYVNDPIMYSHNSMMCVNNFGKGNHFLHKTATKQRNASTFIRKY
jgi:hypothetical protein